MFASLVKEKKAAERGFPLITQNEAEEVEKRKMERERGWDGKSIV